MRAVCYARVSSATQRDRETIASQLRLLPEYVTRNGWELVAPVLRYVDDGKSAQAGKLSKRSGLGDLLRDAALGMFDVVVVVDIDRLTRSEDQAERGFIMGALGRANVKIATLSGKLMDLGTDEGDFMSLFDGFSAASWGRKHKARIKAGKDTAISRGRKPAGPTPFGYNYDRVTGQWSIDSVNGPIINEIYRRIADGESSIQIADDFAVRNVTRPRGGQWTREFVWQLATAATYTGQWTADKRRGLTISVPRIIDDELWHATQAALIAHGKRGLRRTKHVYLLEGLAVCAQCGGRVGIRSATKQRYGRSEAAYVCGNRKLAHRARKRCAAPIAWIASIDAAVWHAVARELADPTLPAAVAARINSRRSNASAFAGDATEWRAKLAKLDGHEADLLARKRRGQIGERALDTELAAVARERKALQRQLATATKAISEAHDDAVTAEAVAAQLRALATGLHDLPQADKAALVKRLIEPGGAILDGGTVRLTLAVAPPQSIDYVLDADCKTQHGESTQLRVLVKAGRR